MEPSDETGLFALPPEVRDDIYKMVLAVSHPLYLFQDSGSDKVELFAPERPPRRWISLLCTNRAIHKEASAALYRFNRFTLVDTAGRQSEVLQSFLTRIGPVNAGHLSRLCINFPAADGATFSEDAARTLELLQAKCANLTILETTLYGHSSGMSLTTYSSNSHGARNTLKQVNISLKAIPSLSRFIVNIYNGPLAPEVVECMREYGWVVKIGR